MLDSKTYLKLTKFIFAGVGLAHLLRIFLGWELIIGGWMVPMWVSYLGVIVAWFIAYNGYKLVHKK